MNSTLTIFFIFPSRKLVAVLHPPSFLWAPKLNWCMYRGASPKQLKANALWQEP